MENEYPQSARRRPLDVDGIAVDYTIVRYGGGLHEDGLGVDGGPGRQIPASANGGVALTVPRGAHY